MIGERGGGVFLTLLEQAKLKSGAVSRSTAQYRWSLLSVVGGGWLLELAVLL